MWKRIQNWWWNRKHANKWVYIAHVIGPRKFPSTPRIHSIGLTVVYRPDPIRVKYRYIWPR